MEPSWTANSPTGRKTTVWNGRDQHGLSVASGVYFYRMEAPGFAATRKMVLLKAGSICPVVVSLSPTLPAPVLSSAGTLSTDPR